MNHSVQYAARIDDVQEVRYGSRTGDWPITSGWIEGAAEVDLEYDR